MADLPGDDGYRGPATLSVPSAAPSSSPREFAVQVELRGYFQPIDGRYHWHGRIAAHEELTGAIAAGRTSATLTTPHGSAPCEIAEPDPWNRYRVTGTSTPPFPTAFTSPPTPTPTPTSPSQPPSHFLPSHTHIAVIGSGFGGLGAGIRLRENGITDFVILERASSVGGTWRDNTYPGCACDVPSHLYSFSFAPNPRWSRSFSRQPEIRAYLEDIADRYGLRRHLRFNTEVTKARWDSARALWHVTTTRGDFTADVLVSATGPLADPALPDIPGLDAFPGEVFHSARWNHDYDLTGKRVAVVGTGASAIQIIPEIQRVVGHLTLFQRTPAWVLPRRDRRISAVEHWLYRRFPIAQKLARFGIYASRESTVAAFVKRPKLLKAAARLARRNMTKHIKAPELRAALTPEYVMGCKRILLSNDYYPALAAPNVSVVASGLAKVVGTTVISQNGAAHDVDAIILATGFHTIDMPIAERIHGLGGVTLADAWQGDMRALRGTNVAGFPNLCLVIGPNTGLGHNSMVHIIESQLNYIVDYIKTLDRLRVAALDPRPDAQKKWCDEIERRLAPSVWNTGGCASWYLNAAGRNPTLWPGSTIRFRRATRRVDLAEYHRLPAPAFPSSLPTRPSTPVPAQAPVPGPGSFPAPTPSRGTSP
jgi:cation diffusion facilitator CzcD-associated flavoprotein CzcO